MEQPLGGRGGYNIPDDVTKDPMEQPLGGRGAYNIPHDITNDPMEQPLGGRGEYNIPEDEMVEPIKKPIRKRNNNKKEQYESLEDNRPIGGMKGGIEDFDKYIEDQMAKEGTPMGIQNNQASGNPSRNQSKEIFSKKQKEEMRELSIDISMDVLEQLFSSSWHTREIAVELLCQEIDDLNNNKTDIPTQVLVGRSYESLISSLWTVNNSILDERISSVLQKGLIILSKLILLKIEKIPNKEFLNKNKLCHQTMMKLLEKLGDYKNELLKDKIIQFFTDAIEADFMDFQEVTDWLMKEKGIPKALNGFKHIIGKLIALKSILIRFESNTKSSYRGLLSFSCKCLNNSNKDVRKEASDIIIEIYRICESSKVTQFLNQAQIRKNHYENLQKRFEKIDMQSGNNSRQKSVAKQQPIVEDVESAPFNKKSSKKNPSKKIGKPCNFCKEVSPDFENDNDYDLHLWRDCPMLITCNECTQVVEIADYTEHLLDECSNNEHFDECERCQLAIPISEFDQHLENMDCEEITDEFITCPLCKVPLYIENEDYEKTWFNHLILKVCPKNQRKSE